MYIIIVRHRAKKGTSRHLFDQGGGLPTLGRDSERRFRYQRGSYY